MICKQSSDIQGGVRDDTDGEVSGGSNGADFMAYHRRFYSLHSALMLAFLVSGMIHNGGNRKYIPVNPNELHSLVSQSNKVSSNEAEMSSCIRAYVNVHSSTSEEDLAAVCCGNFGDRMNTTNNEQYQSNLCHPRMPVLGVPPHRVPFALRLTRPVEAWVLPLLPIFIRLIYQLMMLIVSRRRGSKEVASSSSGSQSITTTLRRLLFYFLLLNFRGWCLYIGANALEDYVILPWLTGNTVVSPLRTNPMSDVEHELYSSTEPSCWYKDVLKAHHKLATERVGHYGCYGRPFDFSDHVVLFLAHYLPIFVMEILIYRAFPFWSTDAAKNVGTKRRLAHFLSTGALWNTFHLFLFLYMHLIILQVLRQTTTYFHTPAETLVGFGISLIVQVPLIYLMCSGRLQWVGNYIGLPCSQQVFLIDKGD